MSIAEGFLRYFLKQKRFRLSRRNGNNLICVHYFETITAAQSEIFLVHGVRAVWRQGYDPQHDKTSKMTCAPSEDSVWSESLCPREENSGP